MEMYAKQYADFKLHACGIADKHITDPLRRTEVEGGVLERVFKALQGDSVHRAGKRQE